MTKIKPIAIHLPQFHPFEENDQWWGKGFTEWTNVTKTKPYFKDHYQPHLPADLGFYDLRLEEARLAQEALAKEYGIYGFCYYHYWFNGKRLMHEPLDRKLNNPKENLPFMLCWANENWTRAWDGADKEVLIEQKYSLDDDEIHIRFLIEHFFKDPRYIRIDNKPFFIIYRPAYFPELDKTVEIWRRVAKEFDEELIIGYMKHRSTEGLEKLEVLDCCIDFQPDWSSVPDKFDTSIKNKILNKLTGKVSRFDDNRVVSYKDFVDIAKKKQEFKPNIFPGITPMWDNAARRETNAMIFHDSTPELYKSWLEFILENYKSVNTNNQFVFINAWNEWAEGNHLEPCRKWGRRYLEVTKESFDNQ